MNVWLCDVLEEQAPDLELLGRVLLYFGSTHGNTERESAVEVEWQEFTAAVLHAVRGRLGFSEDLALQALMQWSRTSLSVSVAADIVFGKCHC